MTPEQATALLEMTSNQFDLTVVLVKLICVMIGVVLFTSINTGFKL